MFGKKQILGHVEHEQRLHSIEGKPLPQLRAGKNG